jgi:hypothetical protein
MCCGFDYGLSALIFLSYLGQGFLCLFLLLQMEWFWWIQITLKIGKFSATS